MSREIISFLTRIKKLINDGKRRFERRQYDGRDYLEVLFEDFGIDVNHAWEIILSLKPNEAVPDYLPSYDKKTQDETYIFKRLVSEIMAYIKISIDEAMK